MDTQFIVACDPSENNLIDFIRLVIQYKPNFIISMTSTVCLFFHLNDKVFVFI